MPEDITDETETEKTYEDPYAYADKDEMEAMSELREEEAGTKPVRPVSPVSKPQVPVQKYPTARERHDAYVFKNDSLRKKYDLRNVDPKSINNIFLRAQIKQLKDRTTNKETSSS